MLGINSAYNRDDEWKNDGIKTVLSSKIRQIAERICTGEPKIRIKCKTFFILKLKTYLNNKITSQWEWETIKLTFKPNIPERIVQQQIQFAWKRVREYEKCKLIMVKNIKRQSKIGYKVETKDRVIVKLDKASV